MGKINPVNPLKLIAGFIFKDDAVFRQTLILLENNFGKIDFESPALKFDYTDYYENELGTGLLRKFVSFKKLILPSSLAKIKSFTNTLELNLAFNNKRQINIDPGYLGLAKLVLATTKDFAHRIYLKQGIYADVTLFYSKNSFTFREWTYPDYRTPEYIEIFNHIREIYARQRKLLPSG